MPECHGCQDSRGIGQGWVPNEMTGDPHLCPVCGGIGKVGDICAEEKASRANSGFRPIKFEEPEEEEPEEEELDLEEEPEDE